MENKEIVIFGDGEQIRDYIYVEDLADAFILASVNDKISGDVFNVGSGTGTEFKEMVQRIVDRVCKGTIKHVPWPSNYLNVETGDYITDINKIKQILNWNPKVDLEEGIDKTYDYYKKFKENYW